MKEPWPKSNCSPLFGKETVFFIAFSSRTGRVWPLGRQRLTGLKWSVVPVQLLKMKIFWLWQRSLYQEPSLWVRGHTPREKKFLVFLKKPDGASTASNIMRCAGCGADHPSRRLCLCIVILKPPWNEIIICVTFSDVTWSQPKYSSLETAE